jgi:hypothetical protein
VTVRRTVRCHHDHVRGDPDHPISCLLSVIAGIVRSRRDYQPERKRIPERGWRPGTDLILHHGTMTCIAGEREEVVRDVLGGATTLTGFYSYDEIAPFDPSARCELHNQTMTNTTLPES